MNWFILTIFSIFALATAELAQQHLLNIKNAFNERTSAFLTLLFQSIITIPLIFVFGLTDGIFSIFNPSLFPRFLFVTFISTIATLLYFKSFKVKNISISSIFTSFSTIVSTILGIIFLSESTGYLKFVGIILIMIAIILVNYKNAILEKNHLYGLAAGSIFGVSYVIDKSIILNIDPIIYMFWIFLFISIWSFLFDIKGACNLLKIKSMDSYWSIVISGIGYFLFNLFTFSAYKIGGEVGRIDAINNSQIFLIILFEFFILKHTKGTARKIFSAGLAILGIFILGLVK